jgi:hypothetical protein
MNIKKDSLFIDMVEALKANDVARKKGQYLPCDLNRHGYNTSEIIDVVFTEGGPAAIYRIHIRYGRIENAWLVFQWKGPEILEELNFDYFQMLEQEFGHLWGAA